MSDLLIQGESALLLLVKFGLIPFLLIYTIFAGIVIKQVRMMTDTLDLGFETPIKFIVFVHFILSLVVLTMAFFVL